MSYQVDKKENMVGGEGLEPPTKAFRFVVIPNLPGLSLHLRPQKLPLGGSRLVSTPSHTFRVGLARDCPRKLLPVGFPRI